jgi:hypothetical protein
LPFIALAVLSVGGLSPLHAAEPATLVEQLASEGTALLAAAAERDSRLEQLWLRVLNRPIRPDEIAAAARFLDRLPPLLAGSKQPEQDAWIELCHGLLSTNEFLHEL